MTKEGVRYDIAGLAKELEVDLQALVPLYQSYITEMSEETSEMNRYLLGKDWNMLQRTIHNIKGVSANLKIDDVYRESEIFDSRLKKDIIESAEKYVEVISDLVKAAEKEIRAFFSDRGYMIG